MENLIKIISESTGTTLFVREGTSLTELSKIIYAEKHDKYIAAWVDNQIKDMSYRIFSSKLVRFTEVSTSEGMRIYSRSLFFLLEKAVADVLPSKRLRLMHPVGRGSYCEVEGMEIIPASTLDAIKMRMHQLVDMNLPIVRDKIPLDEAVEMFRKQGAQDKLTLLETRPQLFVTMYNLAGLNGYFYGVMVPSTGYLRTFDVECFGDGLVVMMPQRENLNQVETVGIQSKLFDIFRLNKQWSKILGVHNVGNLNLRVLRGEGGELIKMGEALQEKNFARTADIIFERKGVKLVLIAGPSSSGKTSFAKRLSIQLSVLGLLPKMISLDNYFVNRDATPLDENGKPDFECLEAIDIDSFNNDLNKLFNGEQVELCKFNFHNGTRYYDGQKMQLNERSILIIEGIHALNPALTAHIESSLIFKIYASALTTLSLDDMSVVHTTDNRLLRRMVRDSKYRSRTALETIKGWQSVRRGEDKHIFPYQEQADIMFGTALFFEIPILKKYAIPLLAEVPATAPEYAEANRLTKFLSYFVNMPDDGLPPTSILREFIGGSSFDY